MKLKLLMKIWDSVYIYRETEREKKKISLSLSLSLPLKKEFSHYQNCETRLIRARKLIRVTQISFYVCLWQNSNKNFNRLKLHYVQARQNMHGWVPQYALLLLIRFMYVMFRREKGASWSNGYGRSLALQRSAVPIPQKKFSSKSPKALKWVPFLIVTEKNGIS